MRLLIKIFVDIICLIAKETDICAQRNKNNSQFYFPEEKIKKLLGYLLLSGVNIRKCKRGYWKKLILLKSEHLGSKKIVKVTSVNDLKNKSRQKFKVYAKT